MHGWRYFADKPVELRHNPNKLARCGVAAPPPVGAPVLGSGYCTEGMILAAGTR